MRHARLRAAIVLLWEQFWPAIVPSLIVIMGFATFSWLGLWQVLPAGLRYVGVGVFAIAFLVSLAPLRHLRLPGHASVVRRIETASELDDRPITAQEDGLAMGGRDPAAQVMWREHRRRMAARLDELATGTPAPDANRNDPWALRAIAAVIAFAAFGYSLGHQSGSIADAFQPPVDRAALLSRLDAWINPPTYTRKPPIYLTRQAANQSTDQVDGAMSIQAAEVPTGSEFVVRFVGEGDVQLAFLDGEGTHTVEPEQTRQGASAKAAAETQFSHTLGSSGVMAFYSRGEEIARWPVDVLADLRPSIRFSEIPSAALSGSLQMRYEVEDDYGVVGAQADIRSAIEQDEGARPLVEAPQIALPLPRQRARSGTASANRDLTQHPWAGSAVTIRLSATDDAGQTGTSAPHEMILPGRRFSNPLALAVIEQRRILALDANKAVRVANLLDAVLTAPEEFIDNTAAFTALTVVRRRIIDARGDDALRSAIDLMWEIALAIEFGDLSEAERRLREAQEQLSEALENGAGDEEIQRLMEELRQAMNEFMQQLAREAMQNPMAQNPFGQNELSQMLRQRDLERMMNQIEDLARSGSRDAARQMLSEMQRMMDNLRAGRHMQQRQAEGNQTNQALDRLSELMRQQQELMDETFQMQQRQQEMQRGQQQGQRQQGQQGQRQQGQRQQGQRQQGQQGEQDQMTPEEFAEALEQMRQRQQGLQDELQQLGEELEALGLDPSREFGEAGREMGEAGQNLESQNPGSAAGDQGQALDALQRGAQSMMQQMAGDRQQGGQEMGQGEGNSRDRQRADPLGRSERADGLQNSENTNVPNEIDAQRAREIMEAIRDRLAIPGAPVIERDYLERLLRTQ